MEGAVLIAQEEAAHRDHGMAIHAPAMAPILATLTAGAAREAAATREARGTREALAKNEAEVKALQQALAQERAQKEAEMKLQANAAKQEAIESAQRKVAEGKA